MYLGNSEVVRRLTFVPARYIGRLYTVFSEVNDHFQLDQYFSQRNSMDVPKFGFGRVLDSCPTQKGY